MIKHTCNTLTGIKIQLNDDASWMGYSWIPAWLVPSGSLGKLQPPMALEAAPNPTIGVPGLTESGHFLWPSTPKVPTPLRSRRSRRSLWSFWALLGLTHFWPNQNRKAEMECGYIGYIKPNGVDVYNLDIQNHCPLTLASRRPSCCRAWSGSG